ncbi:MAG: protein TolR [Alphaproteobacteria bacterium]
MAMAPQRSGRFKGRRGYQPMAEINVTPFVDVMLVLLVIFMVTAPLLTVGVPVDLPKTSANTINEPDEPLVVSITATGAVFLQETEVTLETLVAKLQAIAVNRPDPRIYVRGDKSIQYGRIMEVMGTVSNAGFKKVALIAEMEEATPTTKPAPPSPKK